MEAADGKMFLIIILSTLLLLCTFLAECLMNLIKEATQKAFLLCVAFPKKNISVVGARRRRLLFVYLLLSKFLKS